MDSCDIINDKEFHKKLKKTFENISFIINTSCIKEIEDLHPNKCIENNGKMS